MKWLLLITFVILGFLSPRYTYGKKLTMKIGYFTVIPHITTQTPSTEPKGLFVDYLNQYVFPNMDVKVQWKGPLSMLRYIKEIEKGTIDAGLLTAKKSAPGIPQFFYYSDKKTHVGVPTLIIGKRHMINQVHTASDLKNINIGVYTLVKGFKPLFLESKDLKIHSIVGSHWFIRLIKMLKSKKIDAIYMPEAYPPQYALINYDLMEDYKTLSLPSGKVDFHFVFSKKSPFSRKFKKMYDEAYKKALLTYEEYLNIFFKLPPKKIKGRY